MGKLSGLPANSSPTLADLAVLIQAAGPTDTKVTLQNLINFFGLNASIPYKFGAWCNNSLALTASTVTKVPLDSEEFDTGNNFDNVTNYRFTAPIAGFYRFDATVGIGVSGIGGAFYAFGALYKNGAVVKYGQQITGSGNGNTLPTSQVSVTLQLAANDYIELYALCSETGRNIHAGEAYTYMSGELRSIT